MNYVTNFVEITKSFFPDLQSFLVLDAFTYWTVRGFVQKPVVDTLFVEEVQTLQRATFFATIEGI